MALYLAFTLSNEDKQKLKILLDRLKQHSICDMYEDISAFHVTLRKLHNDDQTHDQAIQLMNKWHDKYAKGPITVYADGLYRFINGARDVDWIGLSQSLPLYQIKTQIEKVADEIGYKLEKDQYPYTPHITCGFGIQYLEPFDRHIEPIPITIKKIALWAYDHRIANVHLAATLHEVDI